METNSKEKVEKPIEDLATATLPELTETNSTPLIDSTKQHSPASSTFFSTGGSVEGDEEDLEKEEEEVKENAIEETAVPKEKAAEGEKVVELKEIENTTNDNEEELTKEESKSADSTPTTSSIPLPPPTLPHRPTAIIIPTPEQPFISLNENSKIPIASTSTNSTNDNKKGVIQQDEESSTHIYGICLISFDHSLGPIIEWAYPKSLNDDTELVSRLPFLALPDGAHTVSLIFSNYLYFLYSNVADVSFLLYLYWICLLSIYQREEDYSYFHLLLPLMADSTIFGVSCNRQISSSQLLNKGKEVTRSTVQKAIVVLASKVSFRFIFLKKHKVKLIL